MIEQLLFGFVWVIAQAEPSAGVGCFHLTFHAHIIHSNLCIYYLIFGEKQTGVYWS